MLCNLSKHNTPDRIQIQTLSTAEIQQAALALYRNAEYRLVHEETVEALSNKTVGSGILRYYLEKIL